VNIQTAQRKWRIKRAALRIYLQKVWCTLCHIRQLPKTVSGARAGMRGRSIPRPAEWGKSELTVVFLNDEQMRYYNRQYRKKDAPTDVLSFPVNESLEEAHYLGDILLSVETALRQAKEEHHSFETELRILLLHGVLHLLGYDHEVDSGEMERLERRLRRSGAPGI